MLIYESGTIGTRPDVLPLSIGDGELAETAACVVPLPEVFSYYLQAGRVDVGFLGAAQIDRFGNLNSTVIGPYDAPADAPARRRRRAGNRPARETGVRDAEGIAAQLRRTQLDFCTSAGYLDGHGARARSGARGGGPRAVITDFGMLAPHPAHRRAAARRAVRGRQRRGGARRDRLAARSRRQLDTIAAAERARTRHPARAHARTREAHARPVRVPL